MKYQAFVRAAAVVLSTAVLSAGNVLAQAQPQTMVDTAPLPASERSSNGAVILMDEPVLAQREQMQQLAARGPDTRAMGAGATRAVQRQQTREEIEFMRALEAATKSLGTPK